MANYYNNSSDDTMAADGMNPMAMALKLQQMIVDNTAPAATTADTKSSASLATLSKQLRQISTLMTNPSSSSTGVQESSGDRKTGSLKDTTPATPKFQLSSGAIRYPYNPKQPANFNTDLPKNFNGNQLNEFSGDNSSTCGKLEYLIDYMMEHPDNPNAGQALLQYTQNILSNWNAFNPTQQAQLTKMFSKDITDSQGGNLGQFIVDTIVESGWFSSGNRSSAHNILNQLTQQLSSMGGSSSVSAVVRDAYNECLTWQDNLDSWMTKYTDPADGKPAWVQSWNGMNVYTDLDGSNCWDFVTSSQWGYSGFVTSAHSSFSSWTGNYYSVLTDQIMAMAKDPQLLLMLVQVLFNQGGDMDNHLGGLSDPMNSLGDCEDDLSSILQEFQTGATPNSKGTSTGNWTNDGAKDFMQKIFDLLNRTDNESSLSGVSQQVRDALESILSIGLTNPDGTTYSKTGGATGGKLNNIGDAFIDYMAAVQKGDTKDADLDLSYISSTLTNINPNSSQPKSTQTFFDPSTQTDFIPPNSDDDSDRKVDDGSDTDDTPSFTVFNTMVQNLNGAVTAVQDQSQVQGTLVSSYSELYKQFLSMLSGFTDPNSSSLVALTNALIKNQKSA